MGLFQKVLRSIVLPKEVSEFETGYLRRVNRIGLTFFAGHVPVFALIAWANDTGPLLATLLSVAVLIGPWLAYKNAQSLRAVSVSFGVTAMLMGGILVHIGQGPVQIEMHFYFFALLAMLAMFGNPVVILTASATVAVHHLLLWMFLPSSVFNYDAPIWVVAVHALFVVLEAVATCYIARSFFDNVIGLEKIVRARTAELDDANRSMRLVLDNVGQGLLTLDKAGCIVGERSAVVDRWLGPIRTGEGISERLAGVDERVAARFTANWEQLCSGALPVELCLDQLPSELEVGPQVFRLSYTPIAGDDGEWQQMLVVMTDVSAERQRQQLEAEQREMAAMLDRVMSDRTGFLEFVSETQSHLEALGRGVFSSVELVKRIIHTIKGNSMLMGIHSLADACHQLEDEMAEHRRMPNAEELKILSDRWRVINQKLAGVLGDRETARVEIEEPEFDAIVTDVLGGMAHQSIASKLASMKLEPTERRLQRVAEQAQRICRRLNKGGLEVNIEAGALRIAPELWTDFWSAFIHVVRNAIDHGLESDKERTSLGKPAAGRLFLSTRMEADDFVIAIRDDGRGIDWKKVRQRAEELGLPSENHEDLVEALFKDGLSTKDVVTELSGRGVGMAAVRDACEPRDGRVSVNSKLGQGTEFEFRFPRSSMAKPIPGLSAAA